MSLCKGEPRRDRRRERAAVAAPAAQQHVLLHTWGSPRRALSDSLHGQTLALKLGEDGVPYSMVYVGLDDGPGRPGAVQRPKRFP